MRFKKPILWGGAVVFEFVLLAATLHGSLDHLLFSLASTVIGVIAGISAACMKSKRVALMALFLLVVPISFVAGRLYYPVLVAEAKSGLDRIIRQIEAEYQVTKEYPSTYAEEKLRAAVPLIFRKHVMYAGRSDHFWISFRNENIGLDDRFVYDSEAKNWHLQQR